MYVTFPVASRVLADLEKKYAGKGGMGGIVVKVRLPNGVLYDQEGKIDYVEPTVSATTDTILMRARIANPALRRAQVGRSVERALIDGDFLTVTVAGIEPIMALGVPRKAVLSDQQGNYVYVVGEDKKAEQRRIQLGQSSPVTAVIAAGVKEGELVIVDGIQRVRPGIEVSPGPASPPPAAPNSATNPAPASPASAAADR